MGWVGLGGCVGVGAAMIHSIGDYSNPLGESSGGRGMEISLTHSRVMCERGLKKGHSIHIIVFYFSPFLS